MKPLANNLLRRWLAPALVAAGLAGGVHLLERHLNVHGWALVWLMGQARAAAPEPDPRIVVVAIDEATLADPRLPRWGPGTLDRAAHVATVRRLRAGGAAAIGVDLFFDQPAEDPFTDEELASAFSEAGNAVLALGADPAARRFLEPPAPYVQAETLRLASPVVEAWPTTRTTFGFYLDQPDRDQLVRAFAHELAQVYREARGQPLPDPVGVLAEGFGKGLIAIRWPARPTRGAFTVVSYREIWDGSWLRAHPDGLKDKAVLVGQVARAGGGDVHRTPVGPVPGVFVHAAALQTLFDRSYPVKPPLNLNAALAAVAFLLASLLAHRLPPLRAALANLLLCAAVWGAAWAALSGRPAVWLNPTVASLVPWAVLGTRLFWQHYAARRALGRFVAPELAHELATTGRLAPEREGQREATVLFADLRNYTDLAEGLAPYALLQALNDHFVWMDGVIQRHGGRVDKHVGDALMAVFEGPGNDHATAAVAAAAELGRFAGGRPGAALPFRFGVGLHSGTIATGALGGAKLEYGTIGDTVNVAARLEAATKDLDVPVLLSAATAGLLATRSALVPAGELTLKGRSAPVAVFTLDLGTEAIGQSLCE